MLSATPIRLIAGLGNPGSKYQRTRHNAGFWFIDEVARKWGATLVADGKYSGEVARVRAADRDVWLLKPTTFMNLSGKSVAALANFYRIAPEEVLVVHDELDLPLASAKMKLGGGTAGHNGLTDIAEKLGSRDFWRLRLGIGHPGHKDLVAGYVLTPAPPPEHQRLIEMVDKSLGILPYLESGRLQDGVTWLHTAFRPPKPPRVTEAASAPAAPKPE